MSPSAYPREADEGWWLNAETRPGTGGSWLKLANVIHISLPTGENRNFSPKARTAPLSVFAIGNNKSNEWYHGTKPPET